MTRLARFLDAAADTWRQFSAATGAPSPPPDDGPEQAGPDTPEVHEHVAPTGADLDDSHPPSLLDRIMPLEQCDFTHADRVHRAYTRTTT